MISKQKSKFLNSLQVKKYRQLHQSFLVQGAKSVKEILKSSFTILEMYCTQDFFNHNHGDLPEIENLIVCTEKELSKVSTFQSNNTVLAVVSIPQVEKIKTLDQDRFYLALDRVGDPGNLGTIIRLADWYGVDTILCSHDCADVFNPKVIASTMGAFSRVRVVYDDLEHVLSSYKGDVYGAYLDGQNIHANHYAFKGVLLMGSESHGISEGLETFVSKKITIPKFGGAESLNVAMATGIILDNFRRES